MKKRIISLVICVLTVLCLLPVTALAADTWDGTSVDTSWYNTTDTAFTISTGAQLAGLGKLVNEGAAESGGAPVDFSGETITLDADIDLGGHQWTPIGIYQPGPPFINRPFSGTFDGANHTVSNLAIGTESSPENTLYMAGLFGEAYGGSFKNLNLEAVSIYSSYYDAYVGALVSEVGGTVENCSSSGIVSCSNSYSFVGGLVSFSVGNLVDCHSNCEVVAGSDSYAGGLISQMAGASITNCYATGDVTGDDYVGGLVGESYGSISNSYATGNVTCSGYNGGGFAGYLWSGAGSVSACYATGNVSASGGGGCCIGGFTGYASGNISGCFATGDVTSTGAGASISTPVHVGGFAGLCEGTVAQCFASGDVAGAGLSLIGGFAGCNDAKHVTSTIRACYATGSVTSGTANSSNVGGLAGRNNGGTVQDSYARGAVSGTGTDLSKGAVIGYMTTGSTCTDCYFDTRDSGMTEGIGYNPDTIVTTGLTPDQMTGTAAPGNMTGLDFSSGWLAKANDSKWYFPQLTVFAGSSDDAIKAASLASVTLTPFTVTFNSNSGSAVAPAYGYYSAISEPADPTRDGHVFGGWYTTGALETEYDFSAPVTSSITLYAKWTELTLSSSVASGTIYTGGRITLTPNIEGGTWDFNAALLSRDGNEFTGLAAGTARVTYTVGEVSTYYDVTIEESGLPGTGQDFSWVWLLAGAALVTAAAAGMLARRRVSARE